MQSNAAENLALLLREWRAEKGLNTKKAGEVLGIPHRTVEYIEGGRGFKYPELLRLALQQVAEASSGGDCHLVLDFT